VQREEGEVNRLDRLSSLRSAKPGGLAFKKDYYGGTEPWEKGRNTSRRREGTKTYNFPIIHNIEKKEKPF